MLSRGAEETMGAGAGAGTGAAATLAANSGMFSELFGIRNDAITKSELVIFLRSTVITNPSLDSDELKFFQRFLPQQTQTPTETTPGETAGIPK